MRRIGWIVAGLLAVSAVGASRAADAVEPASVTFTNVRTEAVAQVDAGTLYRGATLVFTNCVLCTTNASTVQGLSAVTVQVSAGNLSTNIDYSATVVDAAAGKWSCTVVIPDLSAWTMQVKVTDANTNSFIYPSKNFVADQSMF